MTADTVVDLLVIGAGPAAVAALDGLRDGRRIALLTGEAPPPPAQSWLHPKIRAVAMAEGEPAAMAEPRPGPGGRPLWSTAGIGGLAGYWGQQCVPALPGDPRPAGFADHDDYLAGCAAVEALFHLEGGASCDGVLPAPHRLAVARLMTGSRRQPAAGLRAMADAFAAAAAARGAELIHGRAVQIATTGGAVEVRLGDGRSLQATQVVLAAGVVGDARLLLASCPDLAGADFLDHTPWLFTVAGLSELLAARPATAPDHFNALTIEGEAAAGSAVFASVYDVRRADLNLLLASTLGLCLPALRGRRPPAMAGLITPVQVWTDRTLGRVTMARDGSARAVAAATAADPALDGIAALLRQLGGRILHRSQAAPGLGFHYHALTLRQADGTSLGIDALLAQRFGGAVSCVDGAALAAIGCRPPTLSLMAQARRRAGAL